MLDFFVKRQTAEHHKFSRGFSLKGPTILPKLMFFSNRKPETAKFFDDTESIAFSNKYTYLGMQFTRNGNLKEAVNVLCDKAMKVMFSLSKFLYTGLTITLSLPLKVFDSTIRPIPAYGSEVWSAEFFKLISKPNLVDKAPFEMVNNKVCKCIAGIYAM